MDWINVKDVLPEENQIVWACNPKKNYIALACLVYEDGWLWAVSNGIVYAKNGKIMCECECDDDYDFTHWIKLPDLPCKSKKVETSTSN